MRHFHKLPIMSALAVGAALLSGCASSLPPARSVFVYVAPNKAITYQGDTFGDPVKLPDKLLESGVTPGNQIIIVPQGEGIDREYLFEIIRRCGNAGMSNVAIRDQFKATSFAQKRGTGIAAEPKPPSQPKIRFSGNDVKKR